MISVRSRLPVFLERAKTQTLSLDIDEDGSAVTPTTALITIYDETNTAIVTDGDVTEGDPSTYSLAAATVPATLELSAKWRIKWVCTLSDGRIETVWQQAHLCRSTLYPVIIDQDLYDRHPDLVRLKPNDAVTGAEMGNWSAYRRQAWEEIQLRLLEDGKRPYLVLDSYALVRCHTALTLARIFRSLSTLVGTPGRYKAEADDYMGEYEALWGQLTLDYDYDEDGEIAADEENRAGESVVYLTDTPASRRY